MNFDMGFRREIARVFPDQKLERIPPDHPLMTATTTSSR